MQLNIQCRLLLQHQVTQVSELYRKRVYYFYITQYEICLIPDSSNVILAQFAKYKLFNLYFWWLNFRYTVINS